MHSASSASAKSMSSRLINSLRVFGALSELDVLRRMEWSLTCPVKLNRFIRLGWARQLWVARSWHLRNVQDELFIRIASQLGFILEPLCPSLLYDGFTRAVLRLVHGGDLVEVNVLVEGELDSRCYVI